MTRIAAYAILILAAILFASTAPIWQVSVRVPGSAVEALAEHLAGVDARSPASPVPLLWGREVYSASCAGCHRSVQADFGLGAAESRPLREHSPRDIHQLITWGRPRALPALPAELPYSGQAIRTDRAHPAFPARLTESERWAVTLYIYSAALDPGGELDDREWLETWESRVVSDETAEAASELYATLCATCHGAQGYGNGPLAGDLAPPPRNLRDTAWLANQSDRYLLKTIENGAVDASGKPALRGMPGWVDRLDDGAILRLVDYIRAWGYSLELPPPRPGAVAIEPSTEDDQAAEQNE